MKNADFLESSEISEMLIFQKLVLPSKRMSFAIFMRDTATVLSAPLTSTIAANLPLYLLSRRLIPAGAMVSGYSAVDTFSRTEAVVLDAKDLTEVGRATVDGVVGFGFHGVHTKAKTRDRTSFAPHL